MTPLGLKLLSYGFVRYTGNVYLRTGRNCTITINIDTCCVTVNKYIIGHVKDLQELLLLCQICDRDSVKERDTFPETN